MDNDGPSLEYIYTVSRACGFQRTLRLAFDISCNGVLELVLEHCISHRIDVVWMVARHVQTFLSPNQRELLQDL